MVVDSPFFSHSECQKFDDRERLYKEVQSLLQRRMYKLYCKDVD